MACTQNPTKGHKRHSGSVLVFVLALIVLLSVLAMRLVNETVSEMRHMSQFHRRDDLRVHAYSALEVTLGTLAEWNEIRGGKLHSPSEGWGNPYEYSEEIEPPTGITLEIEIEDETKFSMETLRKDPALLASFFETMVDQDDNEVGYNDSLKYADAFLDWEDADEAHRLNGAEFDDYYEDQVPPYRPANRPIQSFEEFRLIKGFSPDPDDPEEGGLFFDVNGNETANFHNFKQSVSLHSTHKLNINGASSFLLRFLCGDNDSGREKLEEYLSEADSSGASIEHKPYFQSINDPELMALDQNKKQQWVDSTFKVGRIKITASRRKATFVLHALVEVPGGATKPATPTTPTTPTTPAATTPAPDNSEEAKRFKALNYPFRILSLRENENFID